MPAPQQRRGSGPRTSTSTGPISAGGDTEPGSHGARHWRSWANLSRLSVAILVANILGLALLLGLETYSERKIEGMHRDHWQLSVMEARVLRQFLAVNRILHQPAYLEDLPAAATLLQTSAREFSQVAADDVAHHIRHAMEGALSWAGADHGARPGRQAAASAMAGSAIPTTIGIHAAAAIEGMRGLLDRNYMEIRAQTDQFNTWLLWATAGYALIALFTCWVLYVRVGKRLKSLLAQVYGPMSTGERPVIDGSDEIAQMVSALNQSADRYHDLMTSLYGKNRRLTEMQDALFESQSNARLGSWRFDARESVFEHSPVLAELTGDAALRARDPADLFIAFSSDIQREDVERALALLTPLAPVAEHTLRCDDGSGKTLFCRTRADYARDGSLEGYSGIVQDVTEQQALLNRLRDANRELDEASSFRRDIIDAMPARTAILDSDGAILYVNRRWRDFAGELNYASRIEPGRNYLEFVAGSEEQGNTHAAEVRRGLRSLLRGDLREFHLEYPFLAHDRELWFELLARRMESDTEGVRLVVMHVDITTRKLAERNLLDAAMRDELTGLYSRSGLIHNAQNLVADGAQGECWEACILLDLRGFHNLNDTYGLAMGDVVLRQVAERLRRCLHEKDVLARVGGDEFGILLNCLPQRDLDALLGNLREQFSRPFAIASDIAVHLEVDAGVFFRPGCNVEPELMLQRAELALFHHAEGAASDSWQYYEPRLEEAARHSVALLSELRGAIARDELALQYQPKVELAGGGIAGCEALLRWQHPVRGLIGPAEFVPLLEQSELIVEFGDWALRRVCAQLRAWLNQGLTPVPVSVNISIRQLRREDFVAKVRRTIDEFGIEPQLLALEVTERVFASEPRRLLDVFDALRALGVRLSLDDFGTEYSSLQYLKNFRFDEIKLDQSFIRDMLNDIFSSELVGMIVSIAELIDADVVAEGIETADVAAALRRLKCSVGQGFYFSVPLAEPEFRRLLAQRPSLPLRSLHRIKPLPAALVGN